MLINFFVSLTYSIVLVKESGGLYFVWSVKYVV